MKKQARTLRPPRRYALIVAVTTFVATGVVVKLGILRVYPHPVVLCILTVAVGFLAGYVSSSIDDKRRNGLMFERPFRRRKDSSIEIRRH